MPGSLRYRYTPGEAVYQGTGEVLPWCPEVTRHLVAYSTRGQLTRRQVTVRLGELETTVPIRDVMDGAVWPERFPSAPGTAERAIREVLANLVSDQAARLPVESLHPRWDRGALVLPPGDVLPRGFGELTGTPEDWRALLREIARSPRMALVTGMAMSGLYVAPLGRQSFMVHLPGASSEGKTTTMHAAAAMFGAPDSVILPWSVTKQGPGSWLRGMTLLTGFRDELGAAGFSAAQLESMVFGLLQGAERDMSSKTGEHRESQGSWHGALMSSGNESVIGQIANEGIAARVIEVTGPLTLDQQHADTVAKLTRHAHGHGLHALVERGPTPERFEALALAQLAALGAPDGGVPYRIAAHLSMGLAGVQVLAELAGVPEFPAGALDAARSVLAELVAGLAERGMRPGDRLLAALAGSMASEPSAWPSRERYERALTGNEPMAREIYGWDLTGDNTMPGEVAVIQKQLRALAVEMGINDPGIALRELRKRGLLHPGPDGKHMARLVKVGGRPRRAYVISGVAPEDADDAAADPGPIPPADTAGGGPEPAGGPCAVCSVPGGFCGMGAVVYEGEELPCMGCGEPSRLRSKCRAAWCTGCRPEPIRAHMPAAAAAASADTAPTDTAPPPQTCRTCGQPLLLVRPGREVCERCQHAAERPTEPRETPTGPADTPEGRPAPRGASPAARARTQARAAELAGSLEKLAEGEALRLLKALETSHAPRRRIEARMRAPYWRPELPGIACAIHLTTGFAWKRSHLGPVVVLDRSGAWVAGASSVVVAHGALEHTGDAEFCGRPGYYQLSAYPWTEDASMPNPLGPGRSDAVWVPAPTVALLAELVEEGRWPDVSILDSYTGDPVKLNQGKWADYLNAHRAEAINTYGRDSDEYARVKQAIGECWSLMLGRHAESGVGKEWICGVQRPDWTHAVQAHARAMLWRRADECRKLAPDCAPVALRNTDELVIPAEALEIVTTAVLPGKKRPPVLIDQDGITLGTFKKKEGGSDGTQD